MAFRSVATQAVTLLRLRGIPTVSNNSSSITNTTTTTNTLRSLWVPLARRFATEVEDAEEVLDGLHYAASHEWVKVEGSTAIVGISDHAQKELGDLVFVELPEAGSPCKQGEKFASVESVKAVSDVYSPISGTVVEVNTSLSESPDLINKSPYGDGWLMKLTVSNKGELDGLMGADAYKQHQAANAHWEVPEKDLSRDCNPFAFVGFLSFFSRIKKKYHASTLKCWLLVHLCLMVYGQIPFQFGDGFLLLKMKSRAWKKH
jgi:glycine cleavage system H protein